MKNQFAGYYRPIENDFFELWNNGTFILDANVLLNLYRYPQEARDDLLNAFSKVADRLWIPHQVALEYQENRLDVIAEQIKRFDEVRKVLSDAYKTLRSGLEGLQLKKRHSTINPDELLQKIEGDLNEFSKNLDALEKEQPDVFSHDELREKIDVLFDGKIGKPYVNQSELDEIYQEGKLRYERKCPPGYMDATKAKQGTQGIYLHNGLTIKKEYGDLILWYQIIKAAKEKNLNHIVFITDDDKQDWWWIVESKGKKTVGPRPELIDEIHLKSQVSLFYMYNSERFLEYAKRYLGAQVKEESINQVREIAELNKRVYLSGKPSIQVEFEAVRAIEEWLRSSYPDCDIIHNDRGFPDLILVNHQSSTRVGYEIKYLRGTTSFIKRILRDRVYRGYYEIQNDRLTSLKMVFVVDDTDKVEEATKILQNPRNEIPEGVSFMVGLLVNDHMEDGSIITEFVLMSEL